MCAQRLVLVSTWECGDPWLKVQALRVELIPVCTCYWRLLWYKKKLVFYGGTPWKRVEKYLVIWTPLVAIMTKGVWIIEVANICRHVQYMWMWIHACHVCLHVDTCMSCTCMCGTCMSCPCGPCAGDSLKTLDQAQFGKWTHYLNLKAAVYEAYVSWWVLSIPQCVCMNQCTWHCECM